MMWDDIAPMVITSVIFIVIAFIVKVISDNRVRQSAIEKGTVDENMKNLFAATGVSQYFNSLKWGLVLIGIGLAFLLSQIFPDFIHDEGLAGMLFFLAGLALFASYFWEKKLENQERD